MRVGILGAGGIARSMATAVNGLMAQNEDVELYAVSSRDIDKATAFQKEWSVTTAYGSYEEMLSDDKVDLVYVATPHSHHAQHTRMCIEHNKAALVEKAFTANAKEAREVLNMAKERKVFVTEAIWTRYMPSRRLIDETISSGIIGDVRKLTADLSYPIWNIQRNYDPNLAGGAILDLGVYPINFATMAVGSKVKKISGYCTYFDTGVDSSDNITIEYENGVLASLSASFLSPSPRTGVIYGSKGYISVQNINNPEKIEVFNENHELIKNVEVPKQINGYEYEVLACKKALEEGKLECEDMPHDETIRIMELMDELRKQWNIKFPFEG